VAASWSPSRHGTGAFFLQVNCVVMSSPDLTFLVTVETRPSPSEIKEATWPPPTANRGADMLSRLGTLFFIVLPVVVSALAVAVAVIFALGWVIQHVIA
jgi:hypothetical protein